MENNNKIKENFNKSVNCYLKINEEFKEQKKILDNNINEFVGNKKDILNKSLLKQNEILNKLSKKISKFNVNLKEIDKYSFNNKIESINNLTPEDIFENNNNLQYENKIPLKINLSPLSSYNINKVKVNNNNNVLKISNPSNINDIKENKKKRSSRKKYIIRTPEMKSIIINHYLFVDKNETLKNFKVDENNIIRWIKYGIYNKKKPGRNLDDPEMEGKLKNFLDKFMIKNKRRPTNSLILIKAFEFSNNKNFKGSKGWLDKFLKRNTKYV